MDRFDLGEHKRVVSTKSAKAQQFFDLGLNWCFGFNHEEGVACFQRALEGIVKLTGGFVNRTKPYDQSQTIRGL